MTIIIEKQKHSLSWYTMHTTANQNTTSLNVSHTCENGTRVHSLLLGIWMTTCLAFATDLRWAGTHNRDSYRERRKKMFLCFHRVSFCHFDSNLPLLRLKAFPNSPHIIQEQWAIFCNSFAFSFSCYIRVSKITGWVSGANYSFLSFLFFSCFFSISQKFKIQIQQVNIFHLTYQPLVILILNL